MVYAKLLDAFNFADFVNSSGPSLLLFVVVLWISLRVVKSWNLKKPPGPVGLPIVGYSPFLGEEPHKTLWKLSRKYGDIIGLYNGGEYTVFLNEYNLVKEVLNHPSALHKQSKLFNHLPKIGFAEANGEAWAEQRKFSRFATRVVGLGESVWENLIMEEVLSFINEVRAKSGEAFEVSHSLSVSIISNILSILIGRRLKKEEEADKINISVEYSDVVLTSTSVSKLVTVVPGLRKFCEVLRIGDHHKIFHKIQRFVKFLRDEINRHKTCTSPQDVDDFISIYLNKLSDLKKSSAGKSRKHYFSEEMLEGNVNLLFLGGTDTIISSLLWLIRLMAKHKDVQEKVHAELMKVIGYEGRARYRERQNIPYTFAVLMESQRVSSIVSLSPNRKTIQDIHIRGFTIPKDTQVTANLWALHHDPAYWENPEEFRPERFLTDNGTKVITYLPSYLPFSVGRRNCPGDTIAWMEILFYFAEMVKNFEISTIPAEEPKFDVTYGLVTRLKDQSLCFKERKRNI